MESPEIHLQLVEDIPSLGKAGSTVSIKGPDELIAVTQYLEPSWAGLFLTLISEGRVVPVSPSISCETCAAQLRRVVGMPVTPPPCRRSVVPRVASYLKLMP